MKKTTFTIIFTLVFCAFAFGQNSNCPAVSVIGPSASVQVGETATFSVSITGSSDDNLEYVWSDDNLEYVWTVSSGKIIEGQGTPTITVEITTISTPTATVEVKGLPQGCNNTDSETAFMCTLISPTMLDEFEISSPVSLEKLRPVISELEHNPDSVAYFIIYAHRKDSSKKLKGREDFIRNYLLENLIKPDRMIFVTANGDDFDLDNSVLRIWRVPTGATPPTP